MSTTSDDIIKLFNKANEYQEITSKQFPVISVVLLENGNYYYNTYFFFMFLTKIIFTTVLVVELAETGPFDPLKMLHSLLGPNYPATWPTVSLVGISNNHLDISKSGRALLVHRYAIFFFKMNC